MDDLGLILTDSVGVMLTSAAAKMLPLLPFTNLQCALARILL